MTDSAPSPPSKAEDGSRASGLGTEFAGPLALVVVAGLAIPPHYGVLLPLLLGVVMVVVGERRLRLWSQAQDALAQGAGSGPVRAGLLLGVMMSVGVLLTVFARSIGQLMIEFPAAIWGGAAAIGGGLAWAVVSGVIPARARPVVLIAVTLAVPVLGVHGTRYEAEAHDAHGLAHSGPILGIHPFQTTAVLVDGHGPFDLPINDYVEPDGGRGYGPEALAEALDRALASIAERVYPEGPTRVRRALVDAQVEAVYTPAVWERLSRAPAEDVQPRFIVRSGSFGRHSRIEFVCPGRRIDPRGAQSESVMNRMCPDKYAAEASAGLGVTGRWSGYSEQRGNARVGLFALWGWTRSADPGGRTLEWETRTWAWIVLALVGLTLLLRPRSAVREGLSGVGGMAGLGGVVGLLVLTVSGSRLADPMVSLWPTGPAWQQPRVLSFVPALALGALVLFSFGRSSDSSSSSSSSGLSRAGYGIVAPAVVVIVATLALAGSLPALGWALPQHPTEGLRLVPLVHGVSESIGERMGLTIFEIEGIVASALVAMMLGGAIALGRAGIAASAQLTPVPDSRAGRIGPMLLALALAAALVFSRKTLGAAALIPGVVGVILVSSSSMLRLAGARWGVLGLLGHVAWIVVGVALVGLGTAALPSHPFVTVCTAAGLVAVILAGLAGVSSAGPPGPSRSA